MAQYTPHKALYALCAIYWALGLRPRSGCIPSLHCAFVSPAQCVYHGRLCRQPVQRQARRPDIRHAPTRGNPYALSVLRVFIQSNGLYTHSVLRVSHAGYYRAAVRRFVADVMLSMCGGFCPVGGGRCPRCYVPWYGYSIQYLLNVIKHLIKFFLNIFRYTM